MGIFRGEIREMGGRIGACWCDGDFTFFEMCIFFNSDIVEGISHSFHSRGLWIQNLIMVCDSSRSLGLTFVVIMEISCLWVTSWSWSPTLPILFIFPSSASSTTFTYMRASVLPASSVIDERGRKGSVSVARRIGMAWHVLSGFMQWERMQCR